MVGAHFESILMASCGHDCDLEDAVPVLTAEGRTVLVCPECGSKTPESAA